MALPILTPDDFIGETKISKNEYDEKDLQYYIDRNEKDILIDLFGCEMSEEIINDLDGDNIPQQDRYKELWEDFCIDDECHVQRRSRGVKNILLNQIYLLYSRDQKTKNTVSGNVTNSFSVSKLSSNFATNMVRVYNDSIEWYNSIQWRICENPNNYDYDNYNGKTKQIISFV